MERLSIEDDFNLYAYTYNDPTDRTDPTGQDWFVQYFLDSWSFKLSEARKIAGEELAKWGTHHNDLGDASRHSEWSYRMTTEIDAPTAFVVGVGHELQGMSQGQPAGEFWMDMNNNKEGRQAAEQHRTINEANLVTSAENAKTNKQQYMNGAASSIASGKAVNIGRTKVSFNKDTGKLTGSTEKLGSRIPVKQEACVDTSKC